MQIVTHCLREECEGSLEVDSELLETTQKKPTSKNDLEPTLLMCCICKERFTISEVIDSSFKSGFERILGRHVTREEMLNITWNCLPIQQTNSNLTEEENTASNNLYKLQLAWIQDLRNRHDWRHRISCFKNGRDVCRYGIPITPIPETIVEALDQNEERQKFSDVGIIEKQELPFNFCIRQRSAFVMHTPCNLSSMSVFHCNNCVKYVENHNVSYYCASYASKYCGENDKAVANMIYKIDKHMKKNHNQQQQDVSIIYNAIKL